MYNGSKFLSICHMLRNREGGRERETERERERERGEEEGRERDA